MTYALDHLVRRAEVDRANPCCWLDCHPSSQVGHQTWPHLVKSNRVVYSFQKHYHLTVLRPNSSQKYFPGRHGWVGWGWHMSKIAEKKVRYSPFQKIGSMMVLRVMARNWTLDRPGSWVVVILKTNYCDYPLLCSTLGKHNIWSYISLLAVGTWQVVPYMVP